MKKVLLIILILIALTIGIIEIQQRKIKQLTDGKVSIVATFYPLAEFAQQVGGKLVDVKSLVPNGIEPHDYEPTPQDIRDIQTAQVSIFNGGELDPWAAKLEDGLRKKGTLVINMINDLGIAAKSDKPAYDIDPHIWLDPVIAQQEIAIIRNTLIKVDPNHSQEYLGNSAAFTAQLAKLDQDYQQGLAICSLHEIITSHAALGYLAQRYNFVMDAISGLSPEQEPSAKRIAEISTLAKDKGIHHVFFETLVSPKIAQIITSEAHAIPLVFNPLEGLTSQEQQQGEGYISIMQQNLTNLKTALSCQ